MKDFRIKYLTALTGLLMSVALLCSCMNDEEFTSDSGARLTMAQDTVRFDTVFTTMGSSTHRFKLFNHNDKGIRMASVALESGGESGFRINVDGHSGAMLSDIEILGKDSLFLFAEVTLPKQNSDKPVLVRDRIVFTLENGQQQYIVLEAWGQDVEVLRAVEIAADQTLSPARPYLIYDSLVVKEGARLTLPAGTTLHFYTDSYLGVHGQLTCEGTAEHPVTLRGHRTDRIFSYLPYDRLENLWKGVTLYPESYDNRLEYTDIHSAEIGINCPAATTDRTKLTLLNSTLHTNGTNNLHLTNCSATVWNCELTNCEQQNVVLVGGSYDFLHTTIFQTYGSDALMFTNLGEEEDQTWPLLKADFRNCIVSGMNTDVIMGSSSDNKEVAFEYRFLNSLINIKMSGREDEETLARFAECVNEQDHEKMETYGKDNFLCVDTYNRLYNYQLSEMSNARGIGNAAFSIELPTDRKAKERPSDKPDAGCYQFQ